MNCVLISFLVAKNSPIDWRKLMIGPSGTAVKICLQENFHIAILFLSKKNKYPSPDCLSHFFMKNLSLMTSLALFSPSFAGFRGRTSNSYLQGVLLLCLTTWNEKKRPSMMKNSGRITPAQ